MTRSPTSVYLSVYQSTYLLSVFLLFIYHYLRSRGAKRLFRSFPFPSVGFVCREAPNTRQPLRRTVKREGVVFGFAVRAGKSVTRVYSYREILIERLCSCGARQRESRVCGGTSPAFLPPRCCGDILRCEHAAQTQRCTSCRGCWRLIIIVAA